MVARAFFLRWPLVSVLEVGASPEAVGLARQYVRASLGEWACPFGIRDDIGLDGEAHAEVRMREGTLPHRDLLGRH
jgi:hypothetical protein